MLAARAASACHFPATEEPRNDWIPCAAGQRNIQENYIAVERRSGDTCTNETREQPKNRRDTSRGEVRKCASSRRRAWQRWVFGKGRSPHAHTPSTSKLM